MLTRAADSPLAFPGTEAAAADIQRRLAAQVVLTPLPRRLLTAAGAAARTDRGCTRAVAVVLSFPDLRVLERSAVWQAGAPEYRPRLRAFFEGGLLLAAIERLGMRPGVVFLRGHGIAHPRRCGLASHLGILLDLPTIGCADSLLYGRAEAPGPLRGDWTPVADERGERIGAAVRTRAGARPLYVSPGHRCDVESAVALALACARFRVPEPLREAEKRGPV